MDNLEKLVSKSLYILRQSKSEFRNPAVMWSTGKDSTAMLALVREAYMGEIPFPVIHLDTGKKFPEIYKFRNKLSKEWGFELIVGKNENAINERMSPDKFDHLRCCTELKTNALKQVLHEHKFDALIMSIRRDEHYMRNLERFFSPRDNELKWHIVRPKRPGEVGDAPFESLQQVELWELYQTDFGKECSHVRVHPILHWTELDVWKYIRDRNLPVNPLYFSKNGKRYRSLGCIPCTNPIASDAKNIDDIIEELEHTKEPERAGRSQDKEKEDTMRKLRALGYM